MDEINFWKLGLAILISLAIVYVILYFEYRDY